MQPNATKCNLVQLDATQSTCQSLTISSDVLVSPLSSLFPLCSPGADKGDQGKEQIPAEGKREEGKKPERC